MFGKGANTLLLKRISGETHTHTHTRGQDTFLCCFSYFHLCFMLFKGAKGKKKKKKKKKKIKLRVCFRLNSRQPSGRRVDQITSRCIDVTRKLAGRFAGSLYIFSLSLSLKKYFFSGLSNSKYLPGFLTFSHSTLLLLSLAGREGFVHIATRRFVWDVFDEMLGTERNIVCRFCVCLTRSQKVGSNGPGKCFLLPPLLPLLLFFFFEIFFDR